MCDCEDLRQIQYIAPPPLKYGLYPYSYNCASSAMRNGIWLRIDMFTFTIDFFSSLYRHPTILLPTINRKSPSFPLLSFFISICSTPIEAFLSLRVSAERYETAMSARSARKLSPISLVWYLPFPPSPFLNDPSQPLFIGGAPGADSYSMNALDSARTSSVSVRLRCVLRQLQHGMAEATSRMNVIFIQCEGSRWSLLFLVILTQPLPKLLGITLHPSLIWKQIWRPLMRTPGMNICANLDVMDSRVSCFTQSHQETHSENSVLNAAQASLIW